MIVRRGFTLVELLITVSIIGIMASMVLFAMFQSQEAAREQKTRALIAKLNNIVMQRYESYRTRRVPFNFPTILANSSPANKLLYEKEIAKARIDCLRDLIRMEMPDRWSDVYDAPIAPYPHSLPASAKVAAYGTAIARPAVSAAYYAKYNAANTLDPTKPSVENQGAECLYMIVMGALAQEGDSRDVFKAGDTADIDGDGFPEFLDAWGSPIEFIRWAPGYQSPLQTPIRIKGNTVAGSGAQDVKVQVTGNDGQRLSQTSGSYVGGTIALIDTDTQIIDPRSMAKITGYSYTLNPLPTPPDVFFVCETPSYTQQKPFGGNMPTNVEFVVMQPDPFDSRGVYPRYSPGSSTPPNPDTSVPTYAIYPLIISKGGDRAMGVKDGAGGSVLRYTQEGLNPFFVAPIQNEAFGLMLGSIPTAIDSEPLWRKGCHLDNITNHDLNRR